MIKVSISEIKTYLDRQEIIYNFSGNENELVYGYSSLFEYKSNSLTFVSSLNKFQEYEKLFRNSSIKLVIISNDEQHYDCFRNVLKVEKPKHTFFRILRNLFDEKQDNEFLTANSKEYVKQSFVSKGAYIHKEANIGTGCVIESGVEIGENTKIHHNVVMKRGTKIGRNCEVLSGSVIGETGFNPLKKNDGSREIIKHYGGVIVEDNVHIGDNCNISKGTLNDTLLRSGVKLNKQVVIAHNVTINKNTVITSPTFVGGSVTIGKNCHIAASTIRNQCTIGDNATLGLGSVVVKDVDSNTTVIGNPARTMNK